MTMNNTTAYSTRNDNNKHLLMTNDHFQKDLRRFNGNQHMMLPTAGPPSIYDRAYTNTIFKTANSVNVVTNKYENDQWHPQSQHRLCIQPSTRGVNIYTKAVDNQIVKKGNYATPLPLENDHYHSPIPVRESKKIYKKSLEKVIIKKQNKLQPLEQHKHENDQWHPSRNNNRMIVNKQIEGYHQHNQKKILKKWIEQQPHEYESDQWHPRPTSVPVTNIYHMMNEKKDTKKIAFLQPRNLSVKSKLRSIAQPHLTHGAHNANTILKHSDSFTDLEKGCTIVPDVKIQMITRGTEDKGSASDLEKLYLQHVERANGENSDDTNDGAEKMTKKNKQYVIKGKLKRTPSKSFLRYESNEFFMQDV